MSGDLIAATLPRIAEHLLAVELPAVGGDMRAVRERHLATAVHHCLGQHLKTTVVATVIPVPEWPSLGRSATDFVVDRPPGSHRFRHVGELKWCQLGDDKVYEAIWDLVKLALITRITGIRTAHLVTGAPRAIWPTAYCTDIFNGGTFEPEALCLRRFPRGRRRTAWDYLLEGGYDRHPDRVPAKMATTPVTEPVQLRGPGGSWELRAVRVQTDEQASDIPFPGGWPNGLRPADAHHPL